MGRQNVVPPQNASFASSSPSAAPPINPAKQKQPSDLIAHYTSQGLDKDAASQKVIQDLQTALHLSFQRYPMQRMMAMDKAFRAATAPLEAMHKRLALVEAKLDTKPDLVQVFGAGVAASAFLQAAVMGVPHVMGAIAQLYGNTRKLMGR